MAEETEEQNDYETFPFDSFIEIVDDSHEDVPEILHEENEETITEAETEITEKSKPYHSKIWEYFEKISEEEEDNIKNYIICNLYQLHLLANNSTTTLEWHLKAKHKVDYDTYKSNVEVKQLGFWATELQQEKYKLFINWIITDQQRFTVVENKNFRKFLSSIQLRYKLPTRHTVKSIIMNKFKDAQKQINNYLQLSTSKISLTIDMWTSITSLDVLYIPSPHNAISIKNAIIEVVTELKIENRLICITTNLKSNLKTLSDNWPTDEEWEILTELANLLALFASITKVISASNYPTIGEIKLLFSGLKAHLNKFQDDNYILQEQLNEMNNVFNNYFDEINKALHIPAFFDSCYKNLSFESDQTPQPVVNELDIYFDSNPPGDEIDPLE
ncbi:hypothetical protein RclHR1_18260001 [Rhizophagus clarus]|uniref:hAT-like transposase RNase-H fold domain-containing protein n=1 Tax=Rhizophagus clarus TaxID=94130 RepID=A0A2Z6R0I8_9GLOM|nr:hypothetical protein RclHR1_18260001 [Rhizophagus clarus]